jgi:hypothetical protein
MVTKTEIIDILSEWNFWGKGLPIGIERGAYLNSILSYLSGVNKMIGLYGIRRSGKSFILRQISKKFSEANSKENVLYINFEETRFPSMLDKEFLLKIIDAFKEIVKPSKKPLIILDEVQEVDGWERVVRSLHEKDKARIIVSGSSSRLMAEELETLLSGRTINIEAFPLSFKEFLQFKNIEEKDMLLNKEKRMSALNQYLEQGGFPETVLETNEEKKREIINSYWDTIIIKDIEKRFKVRKGAELEAVARFVASIPSSLISFRKISLSLGIPLKTVERFFKYLEIARLINSIKKFSWKVIEQERSIRKIYLTDISFFTFSGFKFSKNIGKICENTVAIELLRRKEDKGRKIYYWKDNQQREVDFVIKEGMKVRQLVQVQVTYASSRDEIEKREIKALLKASEELRCKNLLCITWDYEAEERIKGKGIKFLPLWKWLLT